MATRHQSANEKKVQLRLRDESFRRLYRSLRKASSLHVILSGDDGVPELQDVDFSRLAAENDYEGFVRRYVELMYRDR